MSLGEQQDASHVGLVVVERVQLGRGHVERPVLGETVVQGVVQGQQVHVVHRQVICVVAALQVTDVDERRSVKPEREEIKKKKNLFRPSPLKLHCASTADMNKLVHMVFSALTVPLSPVVIHLVDDDDLVADLLLVEEGVHEGDEHQQLFKALSEGDDEGQLVRTPGRVVCCRRLAVGGTGRLELLLLGDTSVLVHGGHLT